MGFSGFVSSKLSVFLRPRAKNTAPEKVGKRRGAERQENGVRSLLTFQSKPFSLDLFFPAAWLISYDFLLVDFIQ